MLSMFLRRLSKQSLWATHAKIIRMSTPKRMKCEQPKEDHSDRMIWVDLEMSGLDVETCHILEMACIVTDAKLNVIAEAPDLIIHQPDEVLDRMDDWCTKHHGQSGLTQAVKDSTISLKDAESQMLKFVQAHTPAGKCPIAGNSVYMDKLFLDRYMPDFSQHLHYRIIDVSTVKELCRRWYPIEHKGTPQKLLDHRALADIKESIAELRYYKQAIMKHKDADNAPS